MNKCNSCSATESKTNFHKCCGKCGKVYYCSRDCQIADWKAGHKRNCDGNTEREKSAQSSTAVDAYHRAVTKQFGVIGSLLLHSFVRVLQLSQWEGAVLKSRRGRVHVFSDPPFNKPGVIFFTFRSEDYLSRNNNTPAENIAKDETTRSAKIVMMARQNVGNLHKESGRVDVEKAHGGQPEKMMKQMDKFILEMLAGRVGGTKGKKLVAGTMQETVWEGIQESGLGGLEELMEEGGECGIVALDSGTRTRVGFEVNVEVESAEEKGEDPLDCCLCWIDLDFATSAVTEIIKKG